MGKKIVNITLFVAVLAAAIGITLYTGQGKFGVMVYNFVTRKLFLERKED